MVSYQKTISKRTLRQLKTAVWGTVLTFSADTAAILGLLSALLAAIGISRHRWLTWVSAPVGALALVTVGVNAGIMPLPTETSVYDQISGPLLSSAIFLVLLQVNLNAVRKSGKPMLIAFAAGSFGVVFGSLVGALVLIQAGNHEDALPLVASMYTGTYIGGGVNFNTIASTLGVQKDGELYAVATGVDNIFTALWILVCTSAGRLLVPTTSPTEHSDNDFKAAGEGSDRLTVMGLSICLFAMIIAILAANWLNGLFAFGHPLLWLTIVTLLFAQTPLSRFARQLEPFGVFGLYLFIASLGSYVSFGALAASGDLVLELSLLVCIILLFHTLFLVLAGRLFRLPVDTMLTASQAAIGGPPTAIALAEAVNRPALRLPGAGVALLGYAIGSFLGMAVFEILKVVS